MKNSFTVILVPISYMEPLNLTVAKQNLVFCDYLEMPKKQILSFVKLRQYGLYAVIYSTKNIFCVYINFRDMGAIIAMHIFAVYASWTFYK